MKYCTNCGKELMEGADFCVGCGYIFNKPKASIKLPTWVIVIIIIGFMLPIILGVIVTIAAETFEIYNSYEDYSIPYDQDYYSNYYHNY